MTLILWSRSHNMLHSIQCSPCLKKWTYHMTHASAKFEVATSNSSGEHAFTRKYIILPICTCKVCSYCIQQFRRWCIYKKIHYLTFDHDLRFKVIWSVALSTLYIMWLTHLQSLKVLCPRVKEKHLQENTLFDLDLLVKFTGNVAQYP